MSPLLIRFLRWREPSFVDNEIDSAGSSFSGERDERLNSAPPCGAVCAACSDCRADPCAPVRRDSELPDLFDHPAVESDASANDKPDVPTGTARTSQECADCARLVLDLHPTVGIMVSPSEVLPSTSIPNGWAHQLWITTAILRDWLCGEWASLSAHKCDLAA